MVRAHLYVFEKELAESCKASWSGMDVTNAGMNYVASVSGNLVA